MAGKIVVPDDKDLRTHITQMHHASLYAGHRGRKKTHAAIEQTLSWSEMHLDVHHFVKICDSCATRQSNQKAFCSHCSQAGVDVKPWHLNPGASPACYVH
eukprot:scaffold63551_cov22-Tisochrysis_lutea.AAC.1